MAKRLKTTAERARTVRWEQIVSAYQRRHRQWVMEVMPRMDDADWDTYTRWVAGFGAMSHNQAYRNSRKMRRRLTEAKDKPIVTVPVTNDPMVAILMTPRKCASMGIRFASAVGKTAKALRATRR